MCDLSCQIHTPRKHSLADPHRDMNREEATKELWQLCSGKWLGYRWNISGIEMKDEVCRLLKVDGIRVDVEEDGFRPLHCVCCDDDVCVTTLLLDAGADPNGITIDDGYTPLHWACVFGHLKIVQLLIRNGAMPSMDVKNIHGHTPLDIALQKNRREVATWLTSLMSLRLVITRWYAKRNERRF